VIKIERQQLKKFSGFSLHAALRPQPSFSELFHENTKLTPLSSRAYGAWIGQIARSRMLLRIMSQAYKVYSLMDQLDLVSPEPRTDLERLIAARRSVRTYTGASISQEEMSRLLFYSYGRTDPRRQYRAVASGGALYPLEIYIVALRIEGLEPGIYHYAVEHHRLDVVERAVPLDTLERCVWFDDIQIREAAALCVITAIFQRSTIKYQDRGYRMVLMEAGEVAQNMALLATSMGLGTCLIGGFHDDVLSDTLGIDGCDEAPLLPIVLGRVPEAQ
jgi:SagB-type dehydrogenase family enzyme